MQRYKCNTKEKHICWENMWTKNGE